MIELGHRFQATTWKKTKTAVTVPDKLYRSEDPALERVVTLLWASSAVRRSPKHELETGLKTVSV